MKWHSNFSTLWLFFLSRKEHLHTGHIISTGHILINLNGQAPDDKSLIVTKDEDFSSEVKNSSPGVRQIWDLVIIVPPRRCANLGALLKPHLRFSVSKMRMIWSTCFFNRVVGGTECDKSVYIIKLTFMFALLLPNTLLTVIRILLSASGSLLI